MSLTIPTRLVKISVIENLTSVSLLHNIVFYQKVEFDRPGERSPE